VAPAPEYALSRRSFLRRLAAFGAVVAAGSLVEACQATVSPSPTKAATRAPVSLPPSAVPTLPPSPTPIPTHEGELAIYGWDGYLADDAISGFEARYGITVRYETFSDHDEQEQRLRSDRKGGGFDVTYPAALDIPGYVQDGIVRPIDAGLVPNLANLAPDWSDPVYDPGNGHSIPNYWWTTGIAWDPATAPRAVARWGDLWSASAGHAIALLDDMRQAFAAAAFALGLDPNTTSETDLDAILAKLQVLKPRIGDWTEDPVGDLEAGLVSITQATSRDWSAMTADLPAAQYVIPGDGALQANDTLAVLAGATHPVAAHLWLDYSLEPQVAANNANAAGTMTANRAAVSLLDDAIGGDPRLNPPADVLANLRQLAPLSRDALEKYAERWGRLRATGV